MLFRSMERLGAIVRRYVRNQYGTTSSHLHGGLPTDRCTAEWWLKSTRVSSVLSNNVSNRGDVATRISVPVEIAKFRVTDPKRAREIQLRISEEFSEAFNRDLAVIGFDRTEAAGTYLLGHWEFATNEK